MFLEVRGLIKEYNRKRVIDNVGFELGKGEILCLLGPSGCGKTTILNIIGGFVKPDSGKIVLNGKVIYQNKSIISINGFNFYFVIHTNDGLYTLHNFIIDLVKPNNDVKKIDGPRGSTGCQGTPETEQSHILKLMNSNINDLKDVKGSSEKEFIPLRPE